MWVLSYFQALCVFLEAQTTATKKLLLSRHCFSPDFYSGLGASFFFSSEAQTGAGWQTPAHQHEPIPRASHPASDFNHYPRSDLFYLFQR